VPDPDYRVVVTVGAHTYDVTYGDDPDYGITLPLTFGWEVPEGVEFFPAQANPTSGSFGIVAPTIADVADIGIGDDVTIDVYVPSTAVDPWQQFVGVVTQVQARPGARNRLTVWFSDNTWRLGEIVVGRVDYPLEYAIDRLERVCSEAMINLAFIGITGESLNGILPFRASAPTDALSMIRSIFRDDATRNLSYDPDFPLWGRNVYAFDPHDPDGPTLLVLNWERRVFTWPADLGADGTLHRRDGTPNALDGCAALTSGTWARLPIDRPTYVIVDGWEVGDSSAPGAVPLIHRTSYVDDFSLPAGNGSATARDFLAHSLLSTDAADSVLWRTDTVRHLSYLDPEAVEGWLGSSGTFPSAPELNWARLRPTIIEPIDPTLTLDGRSWIAGTLSAARFTIPPGGRFYIDLTLRPDLFETQPFLHAGAATYADVPPALTYADLDPLMTYRDLRLIGA
jgi:hypothetical protein